jgi:hypothetical protein
LKLEFIPVKPVNTPLMCSTSFAAVRITPIFSAEIILEREEKREKRKEKKDCASHTFVLASKIFGNFSLHNIKGFFSQQHCFITRCYLFRIRGDITKE